LDKIDLTLTDVIDSAAKIGLGAIISAVAGYTILRKTHRFEVDSRKEAFFYKSQEERKSVYIDFSAQSHALIQKYTYAWCDSTKDDYKDYLTVFSRLQILCSDSIKVVASEAFNAITVFIIFNKQSLNSGDGSYSKLHDDLMDNARLQLAVFQKLHNQMLRELSMQTEYNQPPLKNAIK
jgi:hypothetical protein